MEQKAFDLIVNKTARVLAEQGFERSGQELRDENGYGTLYTGENLAYSVYYETGRKRFELRTCAMTDDGPDLKWKNLSVWLFDPEENEIAEAESIAGDFAETIQGPRRMAAVQNAKKKRARGDETNADPVFFFNRMVNFFPEIKEEMARERAAYGEIRAVTFAREKLLPRMQAFLGAHEGAEPYRKFSEMLSGMYVSGDMDVRSILTIVLLNGLDQALVEEKLVPSFSDDLKKGYKAGLKLRGKKIKPEKKKKPKKYTAQSLNDLR